MNVVLLVRVCLVVQEMLALKKAYADVILNTVKEAAGRVMVSERRAAVFQQELASAKEEALHMLLRLKQMMDAKVFVLFSIPSHVGFIGFCVFMVNAIDDCYDWKFCSFLF